MMWHTCKAIGPTVLAILILIAPPLHAQERPSSSPIYADLSESLETMARLVSPSVVEIFSTSYVAAEGVVPNGADLVTAQRASGSGRLQRLLRSLLVKRFSSKFTVWPPEIS